MNEITPSDIVRSFRAVNDFMSVQYGEEGFAEEARDPEAWKTMLTAHGLGVGAVSTFNQNIRAMFEQQGEEVPQGALGVAFVGFMVGLDAAWWRANSES